MELENKDEVLNSEATPVVEEINETVAETSAEVQDAVAEGSIVEEPQQEEETHAELAGENPSENEAIAQVQEMLTGGQAAEFIPSAQPQELLLMLEQITTLLAKIDLRQAGEWVRSIKERFESLPKTELILQRFSTAYGKFNAKRKELSDRSQEDNADKKRDLITRLRNVVEADILDINLVKQLQAEWKAIGFVAKEYKEEIDNNYKSLLDKFFNRRNQEKELENYDHKINLSKKEEILSKIRTLMPSEEEAHDTEIWKERQTTLNELQKDWKETGFVPKEDRDRINLEYKQALDNFFEHKRQFLEEQEVGAAENGDKKEALLEKMTPFAAFTADKPKAWNEATQTLLALQEEWKTIGKAPAEKNSELWKSFREIGNTFFEAKSAFFKAFDDERNTNFEAKQSLCEKAEALKDSSDWDKAGDELKKLQEEWKAVGPVPDRVSNKVWNRFREACDAFFSKRREHYQGMKQEEEVNLEKKRALIDRVRTIASEEEDREVAIQQIKDIQTEWKEIGRVPIKFKDSIWDDFKAELDTFFSALRSNRPAGNAGAKPRQKSFSREEEMDSNQPEHIQGKISRLRKKITKCNEKIEQYETNILFIARGKAGDALRTQIQKEIDNERKFVTGLQDTIKKLNDLLKNPNPQLEEELLKTVEEVASED